VSCFAGAAACAAGATLCCVLCAVCCGGALLLLAPRACVSTSRYMSSVNGVMAIPSIAGYNASKGGVKYLNALHGAGAGAQNIRVTALGLGR